MIRSRERAEWITFGASLTLLGVLVAAIVVVWIGGEDPARLMVDQEGVRRQGDAYLVDALVRNDGDMTASSVQVLATLTIGDEVAESEQVVDLLGGGEDEPLVFVFQDDPADGELELLVVSYADP